MANKKNISKNEKTPLKKKDEGELSEEEGALGDEALIDPAIVEDTFADDMADYNDIDNF